MIDGYPLRSVIAFLLLTAAFAGCTDDPVSTGVPRTDSLHVAISLPEGSEPVDWRFSTRTNYIYRPRTGIQDQLSVFRQSTGITEGHAEFRVPVPEDVRSDMLLRFSTAGEYEVVMSLEASEGGIEILDPSVVDEGRRFYLSLNPDAPRTQPVPQRYEHKIKFRLLAPGAPCGDEDERWSVNAVASGHEVLVGDLLFQESNNYRSDRFLDFDEIEFGFSGSLNAQLLAPAGAIPIVSLDGSLMTVECYGGDCWLGCSIYVAP